MYTPLSLYIGLRYTRAKRRNQFISFISLVSLLGMVLGVFALVVVLSVMNGFEAELRSRILSLIPHGFVEGPAGRLDNWEQWANQAEQEPQVSNVAPYISGTVMLSRHKQVKAVRLTAIAPQWESKVSEVSQRMVAGRLDQLEPRQYGIVIGDILARSLGAYMGDDISIILPKVTVTPFGVFPRVKNFHVVGVFRTGSQLDGEAVFIHLRDGQKLFQLGQQVTGLRVQVEDLFQAKAIVTRLSKLLPEQSSGKSWTSTQGALFKAVKMEKTMVSLLLLVIVAIAAFNIISILTMMVADKRSDIAVLRTMGAAPNTILKIFIIQGMSIGLLGVLAGVALGVPVALNLSEIIQWFEALFGSHVFNPEVYFITKIPSVLKTADLFMVIFWGIILSGLATLYPAYRASKIHPAEVLRYE
jgi:lipoprotein-releasing system permease protein